MARLCLFLLLPSAAWASVSAERLAAARERAAHLEYDKALGLARSALEAGDATVDETWRIHAVVAQTAASMGLRDAAVESFARALELFPGLELEPTASPRLHEPFHAAKSLLKGARLQLVPRAVRSADGRVRTEVKVEGDPQGLVRGGRLFVSADAGPTASSFAEQGMAFADALRAEWSCPGSRCAYYVEVTDGRGNALFGSGSAAAPLWTEDAPAPAAPAAAIPSAGLERPPPPVESPAWYRRPGVYVAAAAVACALAGGGFALQLQSDQSGIQKINQDKSSYYYRDLTRLDSAQHRDQGLAIGLGAGGVVLGATAAFVW